MLSPAHLTKHIPLLPYPFLASIFHLAQLDDGASNGTALWLGAQCLSLYLAQIHSKHKPSQAVIPPRVVELGSGIGLTACASTAPKTNALQVSITLINRLALSALGWDVLATDIPHVISTVLGQNIQNNLAQLPPASGAIQIRELDWTVPPERWTWDSATIIASASPLSPLKSVDQIDFLNPPYDLICSADTVYSAALVEPLLRTFHALCRLSTGPSARVPPVYLCIERRDPGLVDRLLSDARTTWGFDVCRIPHRKVIKTMAKGGVLWDAEEWEGIEIWKLTLL